MIKAIEACMLVSILYCPNILFVNAPYNSMAAYITWYDIVAPSTEYSVPSLYFTASTLTKVILHQ